MRKSLFTTWEWISLIGVGVGATAGVTVWAMDKFQTKFDAEKAESRIERRLDRHAELLIATMKGLNIPVPPPKVHE